MCLLLQNLPLLSEVRVKWELMARIRGDPTSGMTIVKANEFNYDSQLIISEAKRRRLSNGPLSIMGREEVGTIPMMENLDVPKNGPAMGPVNQAHQDK